jgi:hypothetical protein
MLKQGVHPKIVQERLGHTSIQTTLYTDSHVAPGLQEAAAESFDKLLSPKYNGEGESLEEHYQQIIGRNAFCKASLAKISFGRGDRVVYGAALEKRSPIISERGFESHPLRGEVLEWSNRHAWRACVGFSRPWVRIPPSPPITSNSVRTQRYHKEYKLGVYWIHSDPD